MATVDLYVLIIHHRLGEEVWPCDSQETARRQLARYVAEWWFEEMGERPMPKDPGAAARAYFNAQVVKKPPLVPESYFIHRRDLVTPDDLEESRKKKPKGEKPARGRKTRQAVPRDTYPNGSSSHEADDA